MCTKDCNDCAPCRQKKTSPDAATFTSEKISFTDKITFNFSEKKLISLTDGVLDYAGIEIGRQPYDKIFKVFRDTAEVVMLAPKLIGLAITQEHISLDTAPYNIIGMIKTSDIKPMAIPEKLITAGVENTVDIKELASLDPEDEFSLGYTGKLVAAKPDEPFDFRQVDLMPHHLAKVKSSRCGSTCTFIDGGKKMLKKFDEYKFRDEDGTLNLSELMDLINALPEAVGSLTVENISELIPMFKEIIEKARANREEKKIDPERKVEEEVVEKIEDAEVDTAVQNVESMADEDKEVIELKAMDSSAFKDTLNKMVQVRVASQVKEYSSVVSKAKGFLDAAYSYADKSTAQIMRDCLATQYGKEQFTDSELSTAFKLLRKPGGYEKFGDKLGTKPAEHPLDKLQNKEI